MKAYTLTFLLFSQIVFSFSAVAESEEIKTTDMQNNQMRAPASTPSGDAQVSPEQLAAMKAQIELVKENQKKAEEFLKELENEL